MPSLPPLSLNRTLAGAILGAAVLAGGGTGAVIHTLHADAPTVEKAVRGGTPSTAGPSDQASASPSSTASTSPASSSAVSPSAASPSAGASTARLPLSSLTVTPGAVGPVRIGMTRAQALASGYLVSDTDRPCEGGDYLAWRTGYSSSLDVITVPNGSISSIGISGREPRTRSGYGVGTTYGELKGVAEAPLPTDSGQTGVYVYDTDLDAYIGFLFDTDRADLKDSSRVVFMEVTAHDAPGLYRDGC